MRPRNVAAAAVIALLSRVPVLAVDCPPSVTASVTKMYADAVVTSCRREQEDGRTQFEVKIATKDGRRRALDVSPEGTILLTEEPIPLNEVPPAVMKSFAGKYGTAKPTRAEIQTAADGKVSYEIAFSVGDAKKEATFAPDGSFLEEE